MEVGGQQTVLEAGPRGGGGGLLPGASARARGDCEVRNSPQDRSHF